MRDFAVCEGWYQSLAHWGWLRKPSNKEVANPTGHSPLSKADERDKPNWPFRFAATHSEQPAIELLGLPAIEHFLSAFPE